MEFQKRVNDIEKVIDSQWKANHHYQEIKKINDSKKKHFNKMYNIQDKETRKEEILKTNSVEERVKRLEENMKSASMNELFRGKNRFR